MGEQRCMSTGPVLGRLRQENPKIKTSLGYMARPCHSTNQKNYGTAASNYYRALPSRDWGMEKEGGQERRMEGVINIHSI